MAYNVRWTTTEGQRLKTGVYSLWSIVYGHKRAFTLVELIMVIAILGILSLSGTPLMFYLIKNSVFIPNKLNMDMLASDALDTLIDGDNQAGGLRFSKSITDIQDYQVTFVNRDNQNVICRLDTVTNKLYRSVNGGAEAMAPYYAAPSAISMTGKNNKLFTYYDANEAVTAVPADVRRISITLIAKTGSGSYDNWQGQSEASTSIAVKKYQ